MSPLSFITFAVLVVQVRSQCSSCISDAKTLFDNLQPFSASKANVYCVQGPIIVATALDCLKKCSFQDDGTISGMTDTINNNCVQQTPSCPNVVGTYLTQLSCFDTYASGYDNCTQGIFNQFINRQTPIDCEKLGWALNCQKNANCVYNNALNYKIIGSHLQILSAMAVCNFDATRSTAAAVVTDNSACTSNTFSQIESKCSIGLDFGKTQDSTTLCNLLAQQIDCIVKNSGGCTDALTRYLLPRLQSYAMANAILRCSPLLQWNSLPILTAPQAPCNYASVVDLCFLQSIPINHPELVGQTWVSSLLDRSIEINGFCDNRYNSATQIQKARDNCDLEIRANCTVPHSLLFSAPTTYDDTFAPSLGAFPVNPWGMQSIFSWISSNNICNTNALFAPSISASLQPAVPSTVAPAAPAPSSRPSVRVLASTPSRPGTPSRAALPPTPKNNGNGK